MVDLSSQLTVFLITVGDQKNYPDCRRRLLAQNCKFVLREIQNVAPMERAFQCMLDQCTTPYFVQVDEDMLLKPGAIKQMYDDMVASNPKVAILVRSLYDRHIETGILGVKIYRHAIVRQYPFEGSFSCEMSQVKNLQRDGYQIESSKVFCGPADCVGFHGVHWTDQSIYNRYRNLMLRLRTYGWLGWTGKFPLEFMRRFAANPSDIYHRWAFLGAYAGLLADRREVEVGSDKDYRQYSHPEWLRVKGMLSEGPSGLGVYLTSKCNARCTFCSRQKGIGPTSDDVTPGQLGSVLQEYPSIQSVCIAGFGEPLMSPNLFPVIEAAKAQGRFVSVITNGLLLERYAVSLAQSGVDQVSVSINAGTPELHFDRMGVKDGFRRVLNGMYSFAAKKREGTTLVCSAVVTNEPQVLASVSSIPSVVWKVGCSNVQLVNLLPHGSDHTFFDRHHLSSTRPRDVEALERLKRCKRREFVTVWPELVGPPEECPMLCRSPWMSLGMNGKWEITGCQRVCGPGEANGRIALGWPYPDTWHNTHYLSLRFRLGGDPPLELGNNWSISAGGPTEDQCRRCFGNWAEVSIPEG